MEKIPKTGTLIVEIMQFYSIEKYNAKGKNKYKKLVQKWNLVSTLLEPENIENILKYQVV